MDRLPDIRRDIDKQLDETDAELTKLPRPSSSDPVLEIIYKVSTFFEELKTWLDGTPDADGLVQTLRPTCEVFRKAIRATEPEFRPTDRRGSGMGTSMLAGAAAGVVNAAASGSGIAGVAAAGLAGAAAGLAEEGPKRRSTMRSRGGRRVVSTSEGANTSGRVIFLDDVTKRMNEYVHAPTRIGSVFVHRLTHLSSGPGAENSLTTTRTSSPSGTSSKSFANG